MGEPKEFSIYHWNDFKDKTHCFDYGDFIVPSNFKENLVIDVGIVPDLMDSFRMRDYCDSSNDGIWAETFKIMRTISRARDAKMSKSCTAI